MGILPTAAVDPLLDRAARTASSIRGRGRIDRFSSLFTPGDAQGSGLLLALRHGGESPVTLPSATVDTSRLVASPVRDRIGGDPNRIQRPGHGDRGSEACSMTPRFVSSSIRSRMPQERAARSRLFSSIHPAPSAASSCSRRQPASWPTLRYLSWSGLGRPRQSPAAAPPNC